MRIVEAFSGIGSQKKALELLKKEKKMEYEVVNTIEWDINSIFAYDIIHNGTQDLSSYESIGRTQLIDELLQLDLSYDGKNKVDSKHYNRYTDEALKSILFAIKRTKNLINIKKVTSETFPENIDILTYSFPCQDLSLSGAFHGNNGGINRNANNSSSLLWQVERILLELDKDKKNLPKVLIMENVASILNKTHIDNFNEWKQSLSELGYYSKEETLNAVEFGVPQYRNRTFMVSIYHGNNDDTKNIIMRNLKTILPNNYINNIKNMDLKYALKTDYNNSIYYEEAKEQIPNLTPSRIKIMSENTKLIDEDFKINEEYVRTITTKQDRHPNSGIIHIDKKLFNLEPNKANFRYLTPRESFILMGFDESDYESLINNNIIISGNKPLLTKFKIAKMAGNSVVVNVIKEIFDKAITILNEIKK